MKVNNDGKDNEFSFDKDDILGRRKFARVLTDLIKDSESYRDESFVIALNSAWGNGKTTFIKKWINEFEHSTVDIYNEMDAIPIYYNAWESDDWEDAFTPICSEIFKSFESTRFKNAITEEVKNKFKTVTLKLGVTMVKDYFKAKGLDFTKYAEIIKSGWKSYNEIKKSLKAPHFEEFETHKKLKKEFKELLEEISKENKIVIFIDELDRANPLFAIKTLEVIKHYFAIPNVIFVLGIDVEQLAHSISTVYGQNMDSAGYLARFFDFKYNLPQIKSLDFLKYISNEHSAWENELIEVYKFNNLSLREIKKIHNSMIMFLNYFFNKENRNEKAVLFYSYLLVCKFKDPDIYNRLLFDVFDKKCFYSEEYLVKESSDYSKYLKSPIFPYIILLSEGNNRLKFGDANLIGSELDKIDDFRLGKIRTDNSNSIGEYIFNVIEQYY